MKLASTLHIKAPAERVWQVVAHDFANVSHWASGVPKSGINTVAAVPEGAKVAAGFATCPALARSMKRLSHTMKLG